MTLLRPLLFGVLLALPAQADGPGKDHAEGLEIGGGWTAATSHSEARVFVRIENHGDEAANVVGFHSPLGPVVLMAPPLDGGEPVPLGAYPLGPEGRLDMSPDGPFLLISDVATPLQEGTEFEMTVFLEPQGEFAIHVDVEGPDAESHSHVGHNH
ncbi:MAG: copper chaperone PCu(A)C [Pseudomonadota bacterium]